MNLIPRNFRAHTSAVRRADGTVATREEYQYETAGAVYEVAHDGAALIYRVNFGAWMIAPMGPIHRAIVQHFALAN